MTYQIMILGHYYQPDIQGREQPKPHRDERGNTVEYDTVKQAKQDINDWNNDTYYLSHNESGRPTYVVVKSADGDYITSGRNEDMSNYDWDTPPACNGCGECQDCFELMINQDRQYLLDCAVYKS